MAEVDEVVPRNDFRMEEASGDGIYAKLASWISPRNSSSMWALCRILKYRIAVYYVKFRQSERGQIEDG